MIRVVLDTNVLASGALASDSPVSRVIDAWLRDSRFLVLVSEEMLGELDRAFGKPYFSRRLSPALRQAYLAVIRSAASVIDVRTRIRGVATHPEDDVILATALDGEANYLVTGDRALLALGSYRSVRIVSPREMVELFEQGAFERPPLSSGGDRPPRRVRDSGEAGEPEDEGRREDQEDVG